MKFFLALALLLTALDVHGDFEGPITLTIIGGIALFAGLLIMRPNRQLRHWDGRASKGHFPRWEEWM